MRAGRAAIVGIAWGLAACGDPAAAPRDKPEYGYTALAEDGPDAARNDAEGLDVAPADVAAGGPADAPPRAADGGAAADAVVDAVAPDGAPEDARDAGDTGSAGDAYAAPCTPPPGCEQLGPAPAVTARAGAGTRYPIVLAHGASGFESVGALEYFLGVPAALRAAGFTVYVSEVDPYNATAVRGPLLAAFVDEVLACTCAAQVNLVAHSQGGLDARYVVSTLGYGDRVASITTISTPHRGTPIADLVLGLVPGVADPFVDAVLDGVGDILGDPSSAADLRASLEELSTEGAAAFDAANPDDPQVAAWSWAGRAGPALPGEAACEGGDVSAPAGDVPMFAPMLVTWALIAGMGGENDGLVPVQSARWGHFRGCIPADHLAEITGLFSPFDHVAFYLDIAAFLAGEGL